jgi:hypothetical protein
MVTLHLIFLAFSALIVIIADEQAVSWVFGRAAVLPRRRLVLLHHLTWVGLGGLIVSGVILLLPMLSYALSLPLFQIKLLLVAALVLNAVLIGRLMPIATELPFAQVSTQQRIQLFVSGVISSASWITIASIGFWLFW